MVRDGQQRAEPPRACGGVISRSVEHAIRICLCKAGVGGVQTRVQQAGGRTRTVLASERRSMPFRSVNEQALDCGFPVSSSRWTWFTSMGRQPWES